MSVFYRHRDGSRCRHERAGRRPCPGGSWTYLVDLEPEPGTGRRRQKKKGGFGTRDDAKSAENAVLGKVAGNEAVPVGTVGAFLQEWLVASSPSQRPATRRAYQTYSAHLLRELGGVKLERLGPAEVAGCQARLLAGGRQDGKEGGLSPTTVRGCMVLLRQALDDAVAWRRLPWNPARAVKAPSPAPSPMRTWTAEQTRVFLAAVARHRLGAVFQVLAVTGMRRGEALGLRWADVDLDAGKISVRQTITRPAGVVTIGEPKTDRARRTMSIDPATVAVLRRQRAAQAAERLQWGSAYQDHDLVFAKEDGSPVNPETPGRVLRSVATEAGLPVIRVHDLRHGYATQALAARVNPRTVADRLGHARVNVTLDTYSHVLPEVEEAEALRVAEIILGAAADGTRDQGVTKGD